MGRRKAECECGRKIVVRINGRYKLATDNQHDLCHKCWKAERDRDRAMDSGMAQSGSACGS